MNADHILKQADHDAAGVQAYPSDAYKAIAIILDHLTGQYDVNDVDELREISDAAHYLTQLVSDKYGSTKYAMTPDQWSDVFTNRRTEAF